MNDNIGLAFDSEVITSGKDSGQWRLYAKDNKYKIGDNIVLHGFGKNCHINDVLIYNNVFYTIIEIRAI
ncbi:MAG: hypothetical protein HRU35_07630 [Rickettsiaceae bacterium]|nr:hypothetical protein [Rickettsiaceae bacterium]